MTSCNSMDSQVSQLPAEMHRGSFETQIFLHSSRVESKTFQPGQLLQRAGSGCKNRAAGRSQH